LIFLSKINNFQYNTDKKYLPIEDGRKCKNIDISKKKIIIFFAYFGEKSKEGGH